MMYLGHIVELTDWKEFYDNPLIPYTQVLLDGDTRLYPGDPAAKEARS
jgi:ABC-type oligopeptide transport system ATPase subunit